MKFYKCQLCGNIIVFLNDSGVVPSCCGSQMVELKANTTDGATEKHVPAVEIKDNKVKVKIGSVDHPMIEEHYIQWIVIQTKSGYQCRFLHPQEAPYAEFEVTLGDKVIGVYEYCNLHGLWCVNF